MIGYVKFFDSNKIMSFNVIRNKLWKKYSQIWKKVRNLLNIKFDREPIYGDNDKYIKKKINLRGDKVNTNLNLRGDKVNTNFQSKKIPKFSSNFPYLHLFNYVTIFTSFFDHYIEQNMCLSI